MSNRKQRKNFPEIQAQVDRYEQEARKRLIARIQEYMDQNGKTQNDVAKAMGFNGGTISGYLTRDRFPSIGDLFFLADVLGVPIERLLLDNASDSERQWRLLDADQFKLLDLCDDVGGPLIGAGVIEQYIKDKLKGRKATALPTPEPGGPRPDPAPKPSRAGPRKKPGR